jgi:hypothetical protein
LAPSRRSNQVQTPHEPFPSRNPLHGIVLCSIYDSLLSFYRVADPHPLRLKFTFIDVGSKEHPSQLNVGPAPMLASCYSQPFQVYSAKKFPGVIESTKLSKCFAQQGIKIPIRKDGANGRENDEGDD